MGPKNDFLIAYNLLQERILNQNFCTQCGACEVACPTSALSVDNEKAKRIYDCSNDIDLCPICYQICPHSPALLVKSLSSVADAPIKSEALGYYRKIMLVQAVDPKIRELSHGGGVVTSLLKFGIENKVFDSAIVSQGEAENPAKPKPSVALVPDDILSAVGSKFFPSSVAKAYGTAVYGYGKTNIAFVGVPCHILALRKLEAWQHKISGNLKITIGLFCFGTLSLKPMLEYIKEKYNISPSEIRHMRVSSNLLIQTDESMVSLPLSEISDHILPSCRKCTDFSAEVADISVGCAHPLNDWSTVIIRTKAGEDFFYKAVENGVINTWVIQEEPLVIERVLVAAMQKRVAGLKKAKEIEESTGILPALFLRETETLASVKIESIMTKNVKAVSNNMTVSQFVDLVAHGHHVAYPIMDQRNELVGWVHIDDASQIDKDKRSSMLVSEIVRSNVVVAYPDESALDAFKRMTENEISRVLVLDRVDPSKIVGVVTTFDLMHAIAKQ